MKLRCPIMRVGGNVNGVIYEKGSVAAAVEEAQRRVTENTMFVSADLDAAKMALRDVMGVVRSIALEGDHVVAVVEVMKTPCGRIAHDAIVVSEYVKSQGHGSHFSVTAVSSGTQVGEDTYNIDEIEFGMFLLNGDVPEDLHAEVICEKARSSSLNSGDKGFL